MAVPGSQMWVYTLQFKFIEFGEVLLYWSQWLHVTKSYDMTQDSKVYRWIVYNCPPLFWYPVTSFQWRYRCRLNTWRPLINGGTPPDMSALQQWQQHSPSTEDMMKKSSVIAFCDSDDHFYIVECGVQEESEDKARNTMYWALRRTT